MSNLIKHLLIHPLISTSTLRKKGCPTRTALRTGPPAPAMEGYHRITVNNALAKSEFYHLHISISRNSSAGSSGEVTMHGKSRILSGENEMRAVDDDGITGLARTAHRCTSIRP